MARRLEHVEAAKEEAEKLGASLELDHCSKHIVGVLAINGQRRKIFLSTTTASRNVAHIVRMDVRKKVQEMRGLTKS